MYGYGDHMSGWAYGLMTVGMLLFWALLIVGIVALVRYLGHTGRQESAPRQDAARPTPDQVLAERFARGEISTDEYRERQDVLRSGGRPLSDTRP